jgi:hypothetical protein
VNDARISRGTPQPTGVQPGSQFGGFSPTPSSAEGNGLDAPVVRPRPDMDGSRMWNFRGTTIGGAFRGALNQRGHPPGWHPSFNVISGKTGHPLAQGHLSRFHPVRKDQDGWAWEVSRIPKEQFTGLRSRRGMAWISRRRVMQPSDGATWMHWIVVAPYRIPDYLVEHFSCRHNLMICRADMCLCFDCVFAYGVLGVYVDVCIIYLL